MRASSRVGTRPLSTFSSARRCDSEQQIHVAQLDVVVRQYCSPIWRPSCGPGSTAMQLLPTPPLLLLTVMNSTGSASIPFRIRGLCGTELRSDMGLETMHQQVFAAVLSSAPGARHGRPVVGPRGTSTSGTAALATQSLQSLRSASTAFHRGLAARSACTRQCGEAWNSATASCRTPLCAADRARQILNCRVGNHIELRGRAASSGS